MRVEISWRYLPLPASNPRKGEKGMLPARTRVNRFRTWLATGFCTDALHGSQELKNKMPSQSTDDAPLRLFNDARKVAGLQTAVPVVALTNAKGIPDRLSRPLLWK